MKLQLVKNKNVDIVVKELKILEKLTQKMSNLVLSDSDFIIMMKEQDRRAKPE